MNIFVMMSVNPPYLCFGCALRFWFTFNYEKGYGYEIVVNIYDINYGSGGCADDCPTVKYELVKIVSKKIPK